MRAAFHLALVAALVFTASSGALALQMIEGPVGRTLDITSCPRNAQGSATIGAPIREDLQGRELNETVYITAAQQQLLMDVAMNPARYPVGQPIAICSRAGLQAQATPSRSTRPPAAPAPRRSAPPVSAAPTGQYRDLVAELETIVRRDARSWVMNSYLVDSMRNVRVVARQGSRMVVQGDYTYQGLGGRSAGWVRVRLNGERVECLTYHDFPGTCRSVGDNPAAYVALGVLAVGVLGAASSGGSSGGVGGGDDYHQCVARCNAQISDHRPGRDAANAAACRAQC